MPDESKKNQDKKKNEPKEQRKRNSRNQANKPEKKADKIEDSKSAPKVTVPQKTPVYQDPGPEFYKNLKRETEDILKITEEENTKYKKKEIQSNWSKYEMPIESYEDIEEQDVGADYEKLIQAPMSIGGHFQFKHEKSWDTNTGPSLYDKYFEINMENLSLAVSSVPFYERNGVDTKLFSDTDILSMNNRATKYKQKYFQDKSYSTSETEAHEKISNSLKESFSSNQVEKDKVGEKIDQKPVEKTTEERPEKKDDIDLDFTNLSLKTDYVPSPIHSRKEIIEVEPENPPAMMSVQTNISKVKIEDDFNELLVDEKPKIEQNHEPVKTIADPPKIVTEDTVKNKDNEEIKLPTVSSPTVAKAKDNTDDAKKNPVIESPEDLEKWLDDFLDG